MSQNNLKGGRGDMAQGLFANSFIGSPRIIYTPSSFARSALIHLQETGTLQVTYPHKSERSGLSSFPFLWLLMAKDDSLMMERYMT